MNKFESKGGRSDRDFLAEDVRLLLTVLLIVCALFVLLLAFTVL